MRLIRKLYWIAVVILMVMGFPYNGMEDFVTSLGTLAALGVIVLYLIPGIFRSSSSRRARYSVSGMQNSVIGGLQQGTNRAVTNFMMGSGQNNRANTGVNDAWMRKQEADRRVWERTKAMNEAKYHEYYAKKNAGSYDGDRSGNRAQAARNRAKNL